MCLLKLTCAHPKNLNFNGVSRAEIHADSNFSSEITSPAFSKLTCGGPNAKETSNISVFKKPSENKDLIENITTLDVSVNIIQMKDLQFTETILGQGGQGVVMLGKYLGSSVAIKSIITKKRKG